jgi:hypothetical protein
MFNALIIDYHVPETGNQEPIFGTESAVLNAEKILKKIRGNNWKSQIINDFCKQ